jgi:hypothetical protein
MTMPNFYVNVTEIAFIVMGGALLMVPVLGLTLRFAIPPIVEALGRARAMASAAGSSPSDSPARSAEWQTYAGRSSGDGAARSGATASR